MAWLPRMRHARFAALENAPVSQPVRLCLAALSLVVPLVAVPSARAATIYWGNNIDVYATYLVALGADLRAFTLQAVGKNGAQPRVFDSTKSSQGGGGTGITTTGNLLHHVWEAGFVPTPTTTLIAPGSIPLSIDTHFLVDTSSLFITKLPEENRPVADSTMHPFAGYGSYLTGAFALVGPVGASWDFAYIVVPAGAMVTFSFEIGAAGFASEPFTTALTMTFTPGDVNMDGNVNVFDVNLVSSNWGSGGPAGDANGDDIVDIFDINLVSSNWSSGLPGPPPLVPEPDTFVLFSLGSLALLAKAAIGHACRARCVGSAAPRPTRLAN